MRPLAAVVVDDVLMTPSRQRSMAGVAMLTAVMHVYDVVLLTRVDGTEDWLFEQGIHGYASLLKIEDVSYSPAVSLAWFANHVRFDYKYPIELYIVADPNEASLLFEAGYMVTLFMHPTYARPEWRPDAVKRLRPWGELAAIMQTQAAQKAADERIKDES